ncbi:MAG: hypothetical protein EOM77_05705 [Bacteroidia bacterium]|nr:hypothetical protein [Bacteroidia bacterium]
MVKGKYADLTAAQTALAGTKILYQLATPIETELTPIGNILGFSKGMVYVENIIRKASVYTTNITVTTPIVELDKIIKLNADGSQTELAVSGATIASGGLSFTHSGLTSGNLVLFTYKYDNKLYGRSDITYYDAKDVLISPDGSAWKKSETIDNAGAVTATWAKI